MALFPSQQMMQHCRKSFVLIYVELNIEFSSEYYRKQISQKKCMPVVGSMNITQ